MASSLITQLPALVDYLPPSPEAYALVLSLFQYFPIVSDFLFIYDKYTGSVTVLLHTASDVGFKRK